MKSVRKVMPLVIAVLGMSFALGCKGGRGDSGSADAGGMRDASNSRRITDSPIHAAADRNDEQTIQRLISEGTSPNATLKNGRTPLHVAAAKGQMRAAQVLLAAGADPALQDDSGETPLMMATSRGYEGLVRDMLAKHPDVNAQTKKTSFTALHYAVDRSSNPNIVRMLLVAGADKNLREKKGRTAEDIATIKGNQAMIDALEGRGAAMAPMSQPPMNQPPMNQPPMNQPPMNNQPPMQQRAPTAPPQNPMGNMGTGTTSGGTSGTPR